MALFAADWEHKPHLASVGLINSLRFKLQSATLRVIAALSLSLKAPTSAIS